MKKTLMALSAVALLGFAACDKDDDKKDAPDPAYGPEMKIVEIRENGHIAETWTWDGDRLVSLTEYDDGEAGMVTTFSYTDGVMTGFSNNDGKATFGYSGGHLTSIDMQSEQLSGKMSLEYNGDQVKRVTYPLSADMLAEMVGGMAGYDEDEESEVDPLVEIMARGGADLTVDFGWSGSNIVSEIHTISLTREVSVADLAPLAEEFGMGDLIGNLASNPLAAAFLQNAKVTLDVAMADTTTIAYDNQHSPLQGFFGSIDLEGFYRIFSAANATKTSIVEGARFTVTFPATLFAALAGYIDLSTYGITNPMVVERPMSEEPEVTEYQYEYNASGYPTKVTSDWGTTEYIYAE